MSFFSSTSSIDVSVFDLDIDDEMEPHPFSVILQHKPKKRRIKRKGKRRGKKLARKRKLELSLPEEPESAPSIPAIPIPAPSTTTTTAPAPAPTARGPGQTLHRAPPPFPSADDEEPPEEDIASEEVPLLEEEEEDLLLQEQKYVGPPPVGIISVLMKRRRAKAVQEKRPPPQPSFIADEKSIVSEEVSLPAVREIPKPKPPQYISCKFIKPGPGQYDHYSTIGYQGHDPTRKRAPDFSFGRRTKIPEKRSSGPGPKYNIRDFTMKGKEKPISFPFGKKEPLHGKETTPGPADYKDQSLYLSHRSRSAFLYGRREDIKGFQTPGAIGELTYMGNSRPAACLLGRPKAKKPNSFPSPLSYAAVKPDVYLTKGPSYTMGNKRDPPKKDADWFPTVGTYSPNYDYLLKKRNIVIPTSNNSCVRIVMDMPEKTQTQDTNSENEQNRRKTHFSINKTD